MTQYVINIGAIPNDGTGDPLRTAFNETNLNFDQVFAAGPVLSNIRIANNTVLTTNTNGNLILAPNGTAVVQSNVSILPNLANLRNLGSATQRWATIYAQSLNVSSGTSVNGNLTVEGNLIVMGNVIDMGNIVTDTLTIQLANTTTTANAANGAGITVGATDDIATMLYNSAGNVWAMNIGLNTPNIVVNNISSDDSTFVTVQDGLDVQGDITAETVSAVGNISGGYIFGNISQATGFPATYSNANVVTLLAGFGSNTVSTTGNISGGYFFGNVSQANGFPAGYANANAVAYGEAGWAGNIVPSGNAVYSLGNSTNQWNDLYVSNTTIYMNNVPVSLTAGNVLTVNGNAVLQNNSNSTISTTGNITADYFFGDGSQLTGISTANTGNVTFDDVNVIGTGNLNLQPNGASSEYLNIYLTGAADIHVAYGGGSGNVILGTDEQANVAVLLDGNVAIQAGNVAGTKTWTFDTAGNLTLPMGGVVYETNIPDGALSGSAIALTPPGGTNADQQLLIYPTVNDANHLHLTSGNLYNTELFLGNDNLYVKLANTGNVDIRTDSSDGNSAAWTFDTTGNLNLPQGGVITEQLNPGGFPGYSTVIQPTGYINNDQKLVIYPTGGVDYNHLHLTSGNLYNTELFLGNDNLYVKLGNTGNVEIRADDSAGNVGVWTFDIEGGLTAPGNITTTGNVSATAVTTSVGNVGALEFSGSNWLSFTPGVTIGSGAYTVEAFAYFDTADLPGVILSALTPGGAGFSLLIQDSTTIHIDQDGVSATNYTVPSMASNTWHHIAVTRNGAGQETVFVDGVRSSTGISTSNLNFSGASTAIGKFNTGGQWWFTGRTTQIRAVVGSNVYDPTQTTITVPTESLTAVANTALLFDVTSSGTYITDSSGTQTVTNNGSVTFTSSGPNVSFAGTTIDTDISTTGAITAAGNIAGNYILGNIQGTTGSILNIDTTNLTVTNILAPNPGNTVNIGAGGNNNLLVSNVLVQVQNVPFSVAGNVTASNLIASTTIYGNVDLVMGNIANASGTKTRITSFGANSYIQTGNGTVGSTGNIVFAPYSDTTEKVVIDTTTGNVTAQNFVGNITITGNVTGTSSNVTLVAGSYSYVFDNAGALTLPAGSGTGGGDEGGEIAFTQAPNSTLSGNTVIVDQYVDRIRFFEAGGNTRGAYIDITQAAAGVDTLLNNRVSGIVNAGVFVTMDNLKATVTTSSNRGLSLATVSGTVTGFVSSSYSTVIGAPGGAAGSISLTTTPSTSIQGYNFTSEGDTAIYVVRDNTNNRVYRITMIIGGGYSNNFISFERLL